jgi:hypothetical protein
LAVSTIAGSPVFEERVKLVFAALALIVEIHIIKLFVNNLTLFPRQWIIR